ncbi:MAG: uncharacterized protein QOK42_441 [Frankiaceae bacterium]|jgi:uncharacterized protein YcaQ|nr:uncharacterized protein [Frankiaceae bacterium]
MGAHGTSDPPISLRQVLTLSADDARRLCLAAQGLMGVPDRRAGVPALLRHLGAIQLDTISVLARSHELVPYARLGAVGRPAVEQALWGGDGFEYWAHAACVLPLEHWPLYEWQRKRIREQPSYRGADPKTVKAVLKRLQVEGPLTATDLGGAKKGGPWWDWSAVKVAAEHLFNRGYVACVTRKGWKRVYDLPQRVIPDHILEHTVTDLEGRAALLANAAKAYGVATWDDLADYHRQNKKLARPALDAAGLVEVSVQGWTETGYAHPDVIAAGPPRGRHRTTLLSPFDSLVWHRPRAERLLGFRHRLEAYTPKAKREHGYFVMPLLAGGHIVGRVDPAREGTTLVARQVSLKSASHVPALAQALREAASWVGCDTVALERMNPPALKPAVLAALA